MSALTHQSSFFLSIDVYRMRFDLGINENTYVGIVSELSQVNLLCFVSLKPFAISGL